ncbi:hypothetical protein ACKF11_00665 [Methylobacillus sp. Pita2]|uniref:hypothetical protein n=1 Tax=Methylobacillus sp. Pita2 TaxID=3383245 RepID=UPI0038B4E0AD
MHLPLTISICIMLTACGLAYQKQVKELLSRYTTTDWGYLHDEHEYQEKRLIQEMLKDPDSAKFRFGSTQRMVKNVGGRPTLVWISYVFVNAKNSFGGYTGEKTYAFAYKCNLTKDCKLVDYATPGQYADQLDWQL